MVRIGLACVLSFILIIVESFIVMKFKNYVTIEFPGMYQFVSVWAMNFFLVFSILTQVKMWLENRGNPETQIEQ